MRNFLMMKPNILVTNTPASRNGESGHLKWMITFVQ
jgi:hypothetical protein